MSEASPSESYESLFFPRETPIEFAEEVLHTKRGRAGTYEETTHPVAPYEIIDFWGVEGWNE